MIQAYLAQLDGECMSVWKQMATSPTMVVYLFMLNTHAFLDNLQYFGQGLIFSFFRFPPNFWTRKETRNIELILHGLRLWFQILYLQ